MCSSLRCPATTPGLAAISRENSNLRREHNSLHHNSLRLGNFLQFTVSKILGDNSRGSAMKNVIFLCSIGLSIAATSARAQYRPMPPDPYDPAAMAPAAATPATQTGAVPGGVAGAA